MPTNKVLVVGASRGVGLAVVQKLDTIPNTEIYASVRAASNLSGLGANCEILSMDITSDSSVAAAASQIPELDVLIVNAATGARDLLLETSTEQLTEYLNVNVTGMHRVVKAFLPALQRGAGLKKIVLLSSQSGSMERQIGATRGFCGPYAVTKAAVNMLAIQYHNELNGQGDVEDRKFVVVPMHPGWVATDMGKLAGDGGMKPSVSAEGIVDVVMKLAQSDSAKFFQFDGEILPW